MSDLIDRHAAIDVVHWWYKNIYGEDAEKWICESIENLPSEHQWIPCSERLPEIGGTYLITGKMKYSFEKKWQYFTDIAYNFGKNIDYFWDTCNDWDEGQEIHIIAWMPVPDPWKGEEDE